MTQQDIVFTGILLFALGTFLIAITLDVVGRKGQLSTGKAVALAIVFAVGLALTIIPVTRLCYVFITN